MKRLFSFFLALAIFFTMPLYAKAATYDCDEYIRLTPSISRINSNGSYTFKIRDYLNSDEFMTTSFNITITASACIYNNSTGATSNSNNVHYTISLYQASTGNLMNYFTVAANGESVSNKIPVTTGAKYYIRIEVTGSLGYNEYIKGSGQISNITL